MNVLIVEDHQAVADGLRDLLVEMQIAVVCVTKWEDMMAALKSGTYDIILLDLGLPDSGTKDTLFKIHLLKMSYPNVAVCVITGQPYITREQVLQAGADEFIPKMASPESMGSLTRRVAALFAAFRGTAEAKLASQLKIATHATHSVIKEMNDNNP